MTEDARAARKVTSAADAAAPERLLPRAEALAARLPPLLVAAERVAATVSQGVHGRRRVGQGETFWQFRRYEPGDPSPRIDWRQSAKSDRLYVRETEWEAAQSVWLWRDASPSMLWRGSRDRPLKRERAELLMLALAALLASGGEHIALLGDGASPSSGRTVLQRIAATLLRNGNGQSAGLPGREPLPRYARVVLFGDCLSAPDDIQRCVASFAGQGVRGHLVQVLDPAEERFPYSGRVLFEGLEDEGEVLFGRAETVRDDYRVAFERHQSALRAIARGAGWTLLTHHTDEPATAALLSLYVALAGQGRR